MEKTISRIYLSKQFDALTPDPARLVFQHCLVKEK